MNRIGKPRGVWPTFVFFPGAHAFQGDGPGLVYRHASATWDEPSPEEKEKAMGFQASTTNHTKVTRLKCNTLLEKGMDLNSLTWLLVTCVFFQMYTTPTLIQSAYNLSVRGEEVPCNLTLKLCLIHLEVHQLLEKQLQPSTNLRSWIVENPIHQVLQTHFPTPFHVFPTTLSLWGTNSPRRRETKS